MKIVKGLFIIMLAFMFCGCENGEKGEKVKTIKEGNGDLIIESLVGPSYGTVDEIENKYIINVYNDKTIEYGYKSEEKTKKTLDEEVYKELIDEVCSSKFANLDKDVSNHNVMDGESSKIIVHYDDEVKEILGSHSSNKEYNKVRKMLDDIVGKK